MFLYGAYNFRDHAAYRCISVSKGDYGAKRIAVGKFQMNAAGFQQVSHNLAIGSCPRECQHNLGRA